MVDLEAERRNAFFSSIAKLPPASVSAPLRTRNASRIDIEGRYTADRVKSGHRPCIPMAALTRISFIDPDSHLFVRFNPADSQFPFSDASS